MRLIRSGAVLVALAALTACRAEPTTGGAEYVALGDSYTAAPGIGAAADDDGCFQSLTNYPHLVAAARGLDLVDRSCSGASTTSMARPQTTITRQTKTPQLYPIGTSTRLVTIGIGANDWGLYTVFSSNCVALAKNATSPHPCQDAAEKGGKEVRVLLDSVRGNLKSVLDSVRLAAPSARILVIGYPTIVPTTGACTDLPIAPGDYPFARSLFDGLNQIEKEVAASVGATFIDTVPATRGHDICAKEPWIAGARITRPGATWHPYAEEQQAVARLITQVLS